jgi:hypothetical protein
MFDYCRVQLTIRKKTTKSQWGYNTTNGDKHKMVTSDHLQFLGMGIFDVVNHPGRVFVGASCRKPRFSMKC